MAQNGVSDQKWSTRAAFLTLHLVNPKDIATEREENTYRKQLYHRANFHADRPYRRRDICPVQIKTELHAYRVCKCSGR